MARYFSEQTLLDMRYEDMNEVYDLYDLEEYLTQIPTADVAPKSEVENYKELFNQLLDDFTHAMHYAGKNNNVCNFCEHDCGEGGMCKGRENRIHCHPKWRELANVGEDAELKKKYTEEK